MYFQLVPVSLWHTLINNFFSFFFFWVFCTFWHYKNLQAHFVSSAYSVLESVIFPRSHGSFYWKIELETKIWVLGVFIVANALLILTYMCVTHIIHIYTHLHSHTYTHTYIYYSMYIHIIYKNFHTYLSVSIWSYTDHPSLPSCWSITSYSKKN